MNTKTPRPVAAPGYTIQRRSHCGKLFVTVTTQERMPFEIFIRFGKAGEVPLFGWGKEVRGDGGHVLHRPNLFHVNSDGQAA